MIQILWILLSSLPPVFGPQNLFAWSKAMVTTATPESSSYKRESIDDGSHIHQHNHHQPTQQKKRHKKQKNSKNNNHTTRKRWIETCSETIHHIPANYLAPLTCVVTRIEIDEEPKNDVIAGMKKTAVEGSSNSTIFNGNISNTARPSSLLTQYANEKMLSSMKTQVKYSDVENERQKVFIPVKRHSSAIGPSKVRNVLSRRMSFNVLRRLTSSSVLRK
jgi:hypothetical protein